MFFVCHLGCIEKRPYRWFSETPAALMGALFVVDCKSRGKVKLQGIHSAVDFLAECDTVKLVQQRLVEPLANPAGLGAFHLCPPVVAVLYGEVELILLPVVGAAILCAAVIKSPALNSCATSHSSDK